MSAERFDGRDLALRLHLNENTAGCSPRVLQALRALEGTDVSFYAGCDSALAACSAYLGVARDRILLTNGLDEGLLAAALVCFRRPAPPGEAIVVHPAFDMYAACVGMVGGDTRFVGPGPELRFPAEPVLDAIGPATRLVYITNPNNPTGEAIDLQIVRDIASLLPDQALLLLDEAYIEFGGETFIGEIDRYPNVVVGRTFAKAHGLAALRAGCLAAAPPTIARLATGLLPYNVNVCALAALPAALADRAHLDWYCAESHASRELIYAACKRLGLRFWPSAGNFVLVRVGPAVRTIVEALRERGVLVRDRSSDQGCEGCLRITAGEVAATRPCLEALEEVLCAGES